ncbi:hypothetical protein [Hymenobacter algoricola]
MKRILKSRAKPSVSLLACIRRALPYINPDWLILGEGPVLLSKPFSAPLHHLLPDPGNSIGTNHGTATQSYTVFSCQHELAFCRTHVHLLLQTIQDKERIINLIDNAD